MKKSLLSLLLTCLACMDAGAADWTFSQCVDYARSHNISLRKSALGQETARYDLEAAKGEWQPSLDFSTSQSYTNTPWSQGNRNSYAGSYGLNASWTLWDGGVRDNNIKLGRIGVEQARLATDDNLRTLETDLLQVYLNLLYARETIDINESAVALSQATAERAKALMESGKMSRVDYAQLQSQYEQDRYNLVSARSTYESRCMELKQLLELGVDAEITPAPINWSDEFITSPLPPLEESYQMACDIDLQIKNLQLDREASELDIKVAQAGHSPKISVNAGVGTASFAPGGSFGSTLKQSWNEQVGVTLSLPIFDRRKTSTAVAKAKVQQLNSDLDIEKRRITVAQLVENWYIDTRSSRARYEAATHQLESAQLTDELTNERFRLGYINPVELLNSHSALTEARHSLLQAKYMALLGQKMIEFYRTASVTLN